jgi:hypothetical protein
MSNITCRSITRDIKVDTQEIRHEIAAIRQDTTQILVEISKQDQILEEVARLRALLPAGDSHEDSPNFMLYRYLDQLTSYAETVCGDWNGEDGGITPVPERYLTKILNLRQALMLPSHILHAEPTSDVRPGCKLRG